MLRVRAGDPFPVSGEHEGHVAQIVAVETHGTPSWDEFVEPPILTVRCSCGHRSQVELTEAVINAA